MTTGTGAAKVVDMNNDKLIEELTDRRQRQVRQLNSETNYSRYQWLRRELEMIDDKIARVRRRD